MRPLFGFLRTLLSADDNRSYEILRVLAALSVLVFLFDATWAVIVLHQWDPLQFGLGLGAVLAAVGAAIRWKETPPVSPAVAVQADTATVNASGGGNGAG